MRLKSNRERKKNHFPRCAHAHNTLRNTFTTTITTTTIIYYQNIIIQYICIYAAVLYIYIFLPSATIQSGRSENNTTTVPSQNHDVGYSPRTNISLHTNVVFFTYRVSDDTLLKSFAIFLHNIVPNTSPPTIILCTCIATENPKPVV